MFELCSFSLFIFSKSDNLQSNYHRGYTYSVIHQVRESSKRKLTNNEMSRCMDYSAAVCPTTTSQLKRYNHPIDVSLNSNQCANTSCSIASEICWWLLLFKYIHLYTSNFFSTFWVAPLHCFTNLGTTLFIA